MPADSALVILPVTRATLDDLLATSDPKVWLYDSSRLAVVCVYILSLVPKLAANPAKAPQVIQTALTDLLAQLDNPAALADFRAQVGKSYDKTQVEKGLSLLPELRVDLQAPKEWDVPSPVKADGTFNSDFNAEIINRRLGKQFYTDDPVLRSLGLNINQTRIATALLGNPEEPIHIHGFAGTGKTHMIRAVVHALPGEHTAILAKTNGQMQAMLSDPALRNVHHCLFGQFARDHLVRAGIPPLIVNGGTARVEYNVGDESIALTMDYRPIGELSKAQVAGAVRRVITRFCESDAPAVDQTHLTYAHRSLQPNEKRTLVQYAQQYWDTLVSLDPSECWQPIRHYHLIKWATLVPKARLETPQVLMQGHAPVDLKFAIVDEAHDLTPAMAKLLDQTGVAVYSLGDTFQRIQGTPPAIGLSTLRREMDVSMRAGEGIGRVINPILDAHPRFQRMEHLKGSQDIKTDHQFYKTRRIPQTPYAILCGSNFHVFEYLHQLVNEGASVCLLPGTSVSFPSFVYGLLNLWQGRRAQSPELFRFRDWEALRRTYGRMAVFRKIEKMLSKGYDDTDFKNVLAKLLPMGKAHYTLGRAEDSKNWQFPNVMLSPELFSYDKDSQYVASNLSKVYTAASRAQRTLALPESFDDWVANEKAVQRKGDA